MNDARTKLLEITHVSKSFPGVRALQDVKLEVLSGEVHGLVGENGAGKSTLMAVASGVLTPDEGTVKIDGVATMSSPERARALGLAIVRQEPALMPDLTVAENLYLGVSDDKRPPMPELASWADAQLRRWDPKTKIRSSDRIDTLDPEARFIVEIVKALTSGPKILVLDEPTEHLTAEDVQRLFDRIRSLTAGGTGVIYISHRIHEVQQISNRLTVLRDGQSKGTFDAHTLDEDQIVELIVGTSLNREFPAKSQAQAGLVLEVQNLTGHGFSDVSLEVRAGEIVGLAGISDNGQREFLRALVGLQTSKGRIVLDGKPQKIASAQEAIRHRIVYLPGDRHREGIFADLTVCENFSIRSLDRDVRGLLVSGASEERRARQAVAAFAVKTPGTDTPIGSLSGGNQQKVVLLSVLAADPKVLLVEEPTQGVDVGTRMEIYRKLRETADRGVAVIVMSSDASEVAGLADRVAIFSRGSVVDTLVGDEVSEAAILSCMLKTTSVRARGKGGVRSFWQWASGNSAPLVMVALAILLMGFIASVTNPYYFSTRNIGGMMVLAATLAVVGYGQQLLLLTGGIDLSVGPLIGLLVVVASFLLLADVGGAQIVFGLLAIFAVASLVGLTNWVLVEPFRLHPMVATLASFMAVQAISLLLRSAPAGQIDETLMNLFKTRIGFVPVSFILVCALGVVLEFALYRRPVGLRVRALGSRPEVARSAGIAPYRVRLLAYVGCSILTAVGALALMPQIGIGDPRAGLNFTVTSIAAVVIGGASLFGGRGSFIGTLLGAAFITQVNAVTNFLGLDLAWQSYLLGGMIVVAVAIYSKSRQLAVAS